MARVSTFTHHYLQCCCCKLDISNNIVKKELFKNIFYTILLIFLIVYNCYYFNNYDFLIKKSNIVLGCLVLLSFSLILLYILNLAYLIFIIIKSNKHVHPPRIVPV